MRLLLTAGVLCSAFLAIYLPDLGHGFLKDDFAWILSSRLERSGDLIALFTSNVGFYRPLVSRDAILTKESEGLLKRFFDGQMAPLVAHFADKRKLSKRDIEDIEKILAELKDRDA